MTKKLKRIMICSGTYIVLMSILLIGVSTAKYTQSTVAYSSFGAAGYNVVLLGQDPATETTSFGDGSPEQFGKTLLAGDFTPGMTYNSDSELNTAKVFPFSVANGTCPEDASEVALDYIITLRSTRNLPLNYKLVLGSTVFNASAPKALDKNGHVISGDEIPQMDENGIAWYEWSFKDIGNVEGGTLEMDTPPVFSLCGGVVDTNDHAIIIEWPITMDDNGISTDNSVDYMKEIELLEVRVTSAQQNNTSEVETLIIDPTDDRCYSTGIIVLDSSVADRETVEYQVDYRAFKSTEDGLTYEFTVENGVGTSAVPETKETEYLVSLMVPVMYQENSSGTGTIQYNYVLEVLDPKTGLWQSYTSVAGNDGLGGHEFMVNEYDETEEIVDITPKKSQNMEEYTKDLFSCSETDSKYRIMKLLYFGTSSSVYQNVYKLDRGVTEDGNLKVERDNFRIRLTNTNGSIPSYVQQMGRIVIHVDVSK